MIKKFLSLLIAGLLINVLVVSATAAPSQDTQARNIEKVKENVRKLGTGVEARIEVKLADGTRLKGYIQDAGDDNFVVVDGKTRVPTTVDYSQVVKIKGENKLTAAKVGLTIVKGVAVVATVAAIATLGMYLIASGTR